MSKRTASSTSFASSSNVPTAKRSAAVATSAPALTAYFPSKTGPARPPQPVVASDPITDRQSTFIAHAAPCSNHTQAHTLHNYIRNQRSGTHPVECSHEILAWRCLTLKPGKTGLDSENDFKVMIDGDDDGEKGGSTVIKEVLTQEGGIDVAIVISRLYGGVMLGPVRFAHMRKCASQALSRLLEAQRLPLLLSRLEELDREIDAHSPATASPAVADRSPSKYASLDVAKAERLVAAREKRLQLLRKKHREEEENLWRQVEEQEAVEREHADQPGARQTKGSEGEESAATYSGRPATPDGAVE